MHCLLKLHLLFNVLASYLSHAIQIPHPDSLVQGTGDEGGRPAMVGGKTCSAVYGVTEGSLCSLSFTCDFLEVTFQTVNLSIKLTAPDL